MLKIAIIDDEISCIQSLKSHIQCYMNENNIQIEVSEFLNGLRLIADYKPEYDIIFLDIEMPHMNGIEVAKYIRKSDPHAIIIFVTNMAQYAVEGYEVHAFDYMIKPPDYISFSAKLQSAIKALKSRKETSIIISGEEGKRHVMAGEIIYIEVKDHWLYVHTKENTYEMLGTLKEMEKQLEGCNFVRCNKSYLINLQFVTRMRPEFVILNKEIELKISRARRKEVQFAFIDYYSCKKL